MLDFHHLDPKLSTISAREKGFWRSVRYKPLKDIVKELVNQNVAVLCRNCHASLNATFFKGHISIIQNFNTPEDIPPNLFNKKYVRNEIKAHIRKKIILLEIWDGKCNCCGFSINNCEIKNLPTLETHHPNPKRRSFNNFHKLCFYTQNINKIKDIVVKDNCICLCSNCHVLEQATFFNEHKDEIFKRYAEEFN